MKRSELHPGLHDLLRDDPDDRSAIGILADWLEEQGAVAESEWLSDHLHGMAGVFREHTAPDADLLGSIDPKWLGLQHGLIRTLRVPVGFDRHASRTCLTLSELPLALGLIGANIPDGRTAEAWMPHIRKWLPELRRIQLGGDVDPALLAGFDQLRRLGLMALPFAWSERVDLPALEVLDIDVRGDSLAVLDALQPRSVERLRLAAASWAEVSHTELVDFLGRLTVDTLELEGRGSFAFHRPLREAGMELEEEADFGEPLSIWVRNTPGSTGVYSAP